MDAQWGYAGLDKKSPASPEARNKQRSILSWSLQREHDPANTLVRHI